MTYLDDIWYVGGSRSEVAHAEFLVWQMPIKYLICIIYAKYLSGAFLGNRMPHLDDIWYVGRARAEDAHGDLVLLFQAISLNDVMRHPTGFPRSHHK